MEVLECSCIAQDFRFCPLNALLLPFPNFILQQAVFDRVPNTVGKNLLQNIVGKECVTVALALARRRVAD